MELLRRALDERNVEMIREHQTLLPRTLKGLRDCMIYMFKDDPINVDDPNGVPTTVVLTDTDREIVDLLVHTSGVDLRTDGSILYYAASTGSIPLFELVQSYGSRLDCYDEPELSSLHAAIDNNRIEMTMYLAPLVDLGPYDCAHALALRMERPHLFHMLIKTIQTSTYARSCALIAACSVGLYREAKYLLKNGADPCFVDHEGMTPLRASISGGCWSCVCTILYIGGAEQHVFMPEGITPFEYNARYPPTNQRRRIAVSLLINNPIPCVQCPLRTGRHMGVARLMHGLFPCADCEVDRTNLVSVAISSCSPLAVPVLALRGHPIPTEIPPVHKKVLALVARPWKPSTHILFPSAFRQHLRTILLVAQMLGTHSHLRYLPLEMWLTIMGFVRRNQFTPTNERIGARHMQAILGRFLKPCMITFNSTI